MPPLRVYLTECRPDLTRYVDPTTTGRHTPEEVAKTLMGLLLRNRTLVEKLLATGVPGGRQGAKITFNIDELQAYSQQVWYLLGRGGWCEALELISQVNKHPELDKYPYTRISLQLGAAFALLEAATTLEARAFQQNKCEPLGEATKAIKQAGAELSRLRDKLNSYGKSHKFRIDYANACIQAVGLRLDIESALFNRIAVQRSMQLDQQMLHVAKKQFADRWCEIVAPIIAEVLRHSTEPAFSDVSADVDGWTARAAGCVHLLTSCCESAFVTEFAQADSDLLLITCVEPWCNSFRDNVKSADPVADLSHCLDKLRKGTPPQD